jgi:SP family general alpha glucoside:H+ symporter-like MFS transporter
LIVGIVTAAAGNATGGYYAQASMMLVWLFVYYMTVGPICYAIIGETSSTRLRNKSICLSRIAYYVAQIICNVINPYMLNPTAGDWKGKTGFFWGGCAFVYFVWTWFRLPETKSRTYEELDVLFAQRVKARDFSKYNVDPYASTDSWLTEKLEGQSQVETAWSQVLHFKEPFAFIAYLYSLYLSIHFNTPILVL